MCLFGLLQIYKMNIKEKTRSTANCLIRLELIPLRSAVSLSFLNDAWYSDISNHFNLWLPNTIVGIQQELLVHISYLQFSQKIVVVASLARSPMCHSIIWKGSLEGGGGTFIIKILNLYIILLCTHLPLLSMHSLLVTIMFWDI